MLLVTDTELASWFKRYESLASEEMGRTKAYAIVFVIGPPPGSTHSGGEPDSNGSLGDDLSSSGVRNRYSVLSRGPAPLLVSSGPGRCLMVTMAMVVGAISS